MFCSKCGTQVDPNVKFCKECGTLIAQPNNSQPVQQVQPTGQNTNGMNQQYVDNILNPDMKKWAILSIVVPVVGIIWYFFIGLSFLLAVLIASVGLSFAKKGELADKKLALAGRILNYCLIGLAVVMLISMLIANFAN